MRGLAREILLVSIVFVLISSLMASLSIAATSAPRDLTLGISDETAKSLGNVCFATDVGAQAMPCNPAFIARESNPNFRAQIFAGNNISYLQDVSALLAGDGSQDNVHRLFNQTRASQMEANLEGGYRRPTFGLAFSPYRLTYYSFVRNSSLPVITLLAAQEQSLRAQFGSYIGNDWSWGVQLRGVRRTFISKTFTLTDALAEDNRGLLEPERQNAFYIEPGILKEWTEERWRPQITFAVTQFGAVDRKVEDFPASPQWHAGAAIHPPVGLGNWEIGTDIVLDSKTSRWTDPFRIGSSYELGMTKISGSAGASDYAFGFQLRYHDFTGGLTYTSQLIDNWLGENEWVRTAFIQFGFNI